MHALPKTMPNVGFSVRALRVLEALACVARRRLTAGQAPYDDLREAIEAMAESSDPFVSRIGQAWSATPRREREGIFLLVRLAVEGLPIDGQVSRKGEGR